MKQNRLSIHSSTGDLYYGDVNTNESLFKLDTLTNKSIKYLFFRYNDYLVYKAFDPSPIIHTKLSTDEVVMEKLQNRDWQYLIESLIYKVEKEKDYYKIKTTEDSEMIQDMSKNYRLLRRIHHNLYTTIAENFKLYLSTLTQSEFDEIDSDIISSGLNSLQNVETATELLMPFDFFTLLIEDFPLQVFTRLFHGLIYLWK